MNFAEMLEAMTPEMHAAMKRAVELGKWADGRRLSDEEREACLQAVIAYDARHLPEDARVGYIDRSRPDGTPHGSNRSPEDIIRLLGS